MKPEEVTKVQIISPKSKVKKVISELYRFNTLHIIEHSKSEDLDIGTPLEKSDELSETIIKLRSLIDQLKIDSSKVDVSKAIKGMKEIDEKEAKMLSKPFDELNGKDKARSISKVGKIYTEFTENKEKQKELDLKIKKVKADSKTLAVLRHLKVGPEVAGEYKHINSFVGKISATEINDFKESIREFTNDFELSYYSVKDGMYIALLIDKKKEKDCLHLLNRYSFSEIKVSESLNDVTEESINKELEEAREELKLAKEAEAKIRSDNEVFLVHTEEGLADDIKKAEAPLMFGETKNVAVISGWVPKKSYDKIEEKLNELTDNKIIIKVLETTKEDNVPIKLDNPKVAKPYEAILRMFSIPSNGEVDPTIFMFITFPLFFGFMLGDIGYGLTLLALFAFLKVKIPSGKALLNVMMFCAVSSIIFGVGFGEFYGLEITESHAIESLIDFNYHEQVNEHAETLVTEAEETVDTHGEAVADASAEEAEGTHGPMYLKNIVLFNTLQLDVPFEHVIYPIMHRNEHTVMTLLIISIIVGILHVNFGLLLGFMNEWKKHGFMAAVYEKFSWVLLQVGAALMLMTGMGIITEPWYLSITVTVVAIVLIIKGEGVKGIVELPSVFVHIGSYARLMAIGFASVSLAVVINEMAGPMFQQGIGGIIGGLTIIVIGHTVNIVLGIIGPFLHSLRLHYVEYFGKFYQGGGIEFNPFGKKNE